MREEAFSQATPRFVSRYRRYLHAPAEGGEKLAFGSIKNRNDTYTCVCIFSIIKKHIFYSLYLFNRRGHTPIKNGHPYLARLAKRTKRSSFLLTPPPSEREKRGANPDKGGFGSLRTMPSECSLRRARLINTKINFAANRQTYIGVLSSLQLIQRFLKIFPRAAP